MTIQLPGAIARYMSAANEHDAKAVAACFSVHGTVHDEGQVHRGHAAIEVWNRKTNATYAVTTIVQSYIPTARGGTVTAEVAGNFPGSPLAMAFHFTLGADTIDALEITA